MKTTKRALFSSVVALILCFSMLVGTTFAWFTDEVKSGVNQIVAGNLDIELYHEDNQVTDTYDKLFEDILWEPGAVAYENITVKNEGTLQLKYQLSVNFDNATPAKNGKTLADALYVAFVEGGFSGDREYAKTLDFAPMASFMQAGQLNVTDHTSDTYGIVIYWLPTEYDNDFNMNNEDKAELSIDLGIKLYATQLSGEFAESDSFGPDYDAGAPWTGAVDVSWYNETDTEFVLEGAEQLAGLAQLVNEGKDSFAGKTIKLGSNVDLNELPWTPISDVRVDDSVFVSFRGTFDGCGYTISNLHIDEEYWGMGLFGYLTGRDVVVKNVNVNNAFVQATDCCGVIAGYATYGTFSNIAISGNVTVEGTVADGHVGGVAGCGYYASFENCSVIANTGSIITSAGSFVGGIVGYQCANTKSITNCTVKNIAITGDSSVGGIAGIIASGTTFSGNTVENVVLTKTRLGSYPKIGALIGCYDGSKDTVLADCAVKNVTLNGTYEEYAAYNELYGAGYDANAAAKFDVTTTSVENIINNLNEIVAATPATIQAMIDAAEAGTEITLMPGKYGTIVMKSNITLIGTEGAVVDCINLNGADNVALKNIEFDAAGAKMGYGGDGKERYPANIIGRDSSNKGVNGSRGVLIEGCTFIGHFADGGMAISFTDQTKAQSGNITIKGCTFKNTGCYVDIYTYYAGYGEMIIEGNTFASECFDRPIYLGRYQSSTPVVVKGNIFENRTSFEKASYIQDHSNYGVSFDAADNTFAN